MENDNIISHPLFAQYSTTSLFSSIWNFYKSHFVALFLFALVISLLSNLFTAFFIDTQSLEQLINIETEEELMEIVPQIKNLIPLYVCLGIITLICNICFLHYIIYSSTNRNHSLSIIVKTILPLFIPSLVISILWLFVLALALRMAMVGSFIILLISILLMAYIMIVYKIIFPILLIEGNNIANAISQSIKIAHQQFTKNIWWLFLAYMLYFSFIVIATNAIHLLLGNGVREIVTSSNPLYIILSSATNAIALPFVTILGVTLYFNGLASKKS